MELKDTIFQFKSLPVHYRSLVHRLFMLSQYSKDEDPTGPGIVLGSLQNFYGFLRLHPNLRLPMVSLTPENNIYASWSDERVLSLHFLPDGDIHYVGFKPHELKLLEVLSEAKEAVDEC